MQSRVETGWKDVIIFVGIILVAFGLRLVYVLQLSNSPEFADPQVDELYHVQWAQAIAAGETFVREAYFRAPLYPAFLGAIFKIFGPGLLTPRIIQAVLGSLSCGLLFLIGRHVFGRSVGAIAGLIAAGYWMLIYFDGELLIPSLLVFLDLLLIGLLLRATRVPGVLVYGLAGIVLGLSAIARPNILLFGPAIVIWLVVLYRRELRRAVTYVVCVTVGCLLVVLPTTARNYVFSGDLVLIASQGGVNYYIGNNPESDGWAAVVPGMPFDWTYAEAVERAERASGRELKPSEVSRYYYHKAWEFIREQPSGYLTLLGLKLSYFWSRWEISNNKSIYIQTERFTPLVKYLPLGFAALGPVAILGMVLCYRRRVELFPLWGFALVYMVSVVLFFCNARYRTPLLPVLILLAVWAVFERVAAGRRRRWRGMLGMLTVLVPAALLVNLTPNAASFYAPSQKYLTRLGDLYGRQGRNDLAIKYYRETLDLILHYPAVRQIREQRSSFTSALREIFPETSDALADVHWRLADVLRKEGAHRKAIEHYHASIELDPSGRQGRALFNLGTLLYELRRPSAGLEMFRRAIEPLRERMRNHPNDPVVLYALGRALHSLGRYDEALVPARRWAQTDPENPLVLDCLVDTLLSAARYQEACELLHDKVRLDNPQLINRLAFLLATCPDDALRDSRAALEYARRLCPRTESCRAEYLDTLAAALAETGRYEEASAVARQALERMRHARLPEDNILVRRIRERLRLYEAQRPYRLPRR